MADRRPTGSRKVDRDVLSGLILPNSVTLQLGGIYYCMCGAWITAKDINKTLKVFLCPESFNKEIFHIFCCHFADALIVSD